MKFPTCYFSYFIKKKGKHFKSFAQKITLHCWEVSIFELTLKSPKLCWTLGNINDLQKQGASPNRVRWFEIYSENAESNFCCSNGASAKTNQKLLDCEIEFNRRKSFNSENSFCFCVNPFRIERLAIRCKNVQLALAQAAFLMCFRSYAWTTTTGWKSCQKNCYIPRLAVRLRPNLFPMLRLRKPFIFICSDARNIAESKRLYFLL